MTAITIIYGMYPALDIPECAKIAVEMWDRSGMKLNLDTEELGLYLAVTVERAQLEELGLPDFCHTRIKTCGAHSGTLVSQPRRHSSSLRNLYEILF